MFVESWKGCKPIINRMVTLKNGVTINYSKHLQKNIGFQCKHYIFINVKENCEEVKDK